MAERVEGVVATWFPAKSWGYIVSNEDEYFFHHTALDGIKVSEVRAGLEVTFLPVRTTRGLKAVGVRSTSDAEKA